MNICFGALKYWYLVWFLGKDGGHKRIQCAGDWAHYQGLKLSITQKKTSQYNINMNIFSMSFVHKVRSQWLHFKLIKSTEMPTCYLLTKNCSLQVLT